MAHLQRRMYVPRDTFSSHGFALKTVVDRSKFSCAGFATQISNAVDRWESTLTTKSGIQPNREAAIVTIKASRKRIRPHGLIDNLSSIHSDRR
jgi:hypothetical protein